jgi:hypothetical protein
MKPEQPPSVLITTADEEKTNASFEGLTILADKQDAMHLLSQLQFKK